MGSFIGTQKVAARRIGVDFDDYIAHIASGQKWCTNCKSWHRLDAFGSDKTRTGGKDAHCSASRKERYSHEPVPPLLRKPMGTPRHSPRDNDKLQARHHVNLSVKAGRLPIPNAIPCADCGHVVTSSNPSRKEAHEYDHYLGYGADNHLLVQAVCVPCHHQREKARRNVRKNKNRVDTIA